MMGIYYQCKEKNMDFPDKCKREVLPSKYYIYTCKMEEIISIYAFGLSNAYIYWNPREIYITHILILSP